MIENNLNYIKSSSNILFQFEKSNEIPVDTFINTINSFNNSLHMVSEEIDSKARFDLKIKAIKKGSFLAYFGLDVSSLASLLLSPVALSSYIVSIWSGILTIKRHLRGEKPKSVVQIGDNYNIVNIYNQAIVSSKEEAEIYFKNSGVDNALTDMASILNRDVNITSVKIITGKKELELDKEELKLMSKKIVEEKSEKKITYNIDVPLQLKKPDLLGESKWQFVYTKVIEAEIKDESFKELVHRRKIKNLYAGVRIPVKLQIEQDMDENGMFIPDTERYTVLKVTGAIIEPDETPENEQITGENWKLFHNNSKKLFYDDMKYEKNINNDGEKENLDDDSIDEKNSPEFE